MKSLKTLRSSLAQDPEVSSVLQSSIKEGVLRTNIPKLPTLSRGMPRGKCHLTSGVMNCTL